MAEISAKLVKDLRDKTGAGMMDCKSALDEANGDLEKAIELLRKKGLAQAAKRAGRVAKDGIIGHYIHMGGKIGVLLEMNSETDFSARNEKLRELLKDVCMHISAAAPKYVRREEVPVERGVTRALNVSLSVSAGFMTVFIIVGSISRLFTDWLNQNAKYVALVIGIALFALGVAMLFGYRLPFSTPKIDIGDRARDRTFVSMYLFGVAYAIASIGCTIGPFSATVLGTIDTDGFVTGLVAIALYGIAMSLLVSALTVSIALARSGLLRVLRTGMRYVEIASAVIMILSGSYLAWYWFNDIREKYDDDLTGRVIGWQERLSQ